MGLQIMIYDKKKFIFLGSKVSTTAYSSFQRLTVGLHLVINQYSTPVVFNVGYAYL
jgi:hypothetical protein